MDPHSRKLGGQPINLNHSNFRDVRQIREGPILGDHRARWLRNTLLAISLILITLVISGCVTLKDPESSQEYNSDIVAVLNSSTTVGQTFVSRRPRMNGILLWLRVSPSSPPEETMIVKLYHTPDDPAPLVSIPITYGQIARNYPITVTFPPQDDPEDQVYYLEMETKGRDIQVFGRAEDAYADGWLSIEDRALDADLGFRLTYDYDIFAFFVDLQFYLKNMWGVLPLLVVLWLPGRLMTELIPRTGTRDNPFFDWGERQAISVGLSLAALPLVMLWTSSLGLHWSRGAALATSAALAAIAGGYFWRSWKRTPKSDRNLLSSFNWTALSLSLIFVIALGVRLAMVRDLGAPVWVDPVHHATITRLIFEQGSLPENYLPYVETESAGYHYGFHTLTAFFLWLSGMDIHKGMLLLGQVLNALMVIAVYLFTTTFTRDRTAGLFAAVVTGFFTPMPAYYVSWGRYTQLAGLLILPVCLALLKYLIERERNFPLWILTSVACAGLFLVHYRVVIFLAILLVAYLLAWILKSLVRGGFWRKSSLAVGVIFIVGATAILLTLPWWPSFFDILEQVAGSTSQNLTVQFQRVNLGYLTPAYGKTVMILAGIGLIWSVIRGRWFGVILALWSALLFLVANPGITYLPTGGLINQSSVEIMLFLPMSTLAGYILASVVQAGMRAVPGWFEKPYVIGIGTAVSVLIFFGARILLPILNPITVLYRIADQPAMSWIAQNIPQDQTVQINPFLWGYGQYAGHDGGYWITPLTGRRTSPPPLLYAFGGSPEKIQSINEFSRMVIEQSEDPSALYELLSSNGIRYLYIGARGGIFSPRALSESPLFDPIYKRDNTYVFELNKREVNPNSP